jgi:hypothetical protein
MRPLWTQLVVNRELSDVEVLESVGEYPEIRTVRTAIFGPPRPTVACTGTPDVLRSIGGHYEADIGTEPRKGKEML